MDIAAPPVKRPSYIPFSDTVALSEDEEDGDGSSEECHGAVVVENAGNGWKVPVPEGIVQNWEGQWNVADVKDVQKMLRMLR